MTNEVWDAVLLGVLLLNASVIGYVAKERNRSFILWSALGFIFFLFAWLLLFFIPAEKKEYQ